MKSKLCRILSLSMILMLLVFSVLSVRADGTGYADILRSVDYGDQVTYVIGHESPDADTIGTAIAYAHLLRQLGINAEAAATAKVNQETKYALDYYDMEQPEILENAAGKQFVLVDEYMRMYQGRPTMGTNLLQLC